MKKKALSILLLCCMVLTLLPVEVSAATNTVSAGAVEDFVKKAESKNGQGRFSGLPSSGDWCGYFVGWALDNSKVSSETGKKYLAGSGGSCFSMRDLATQGYGTIYIAPGSATKPYADKYYSRFVDRYSTPKSNIQINYSFTPQRGDIVLFDWLDDVIGDFDHVGIMTSSTTTIEGNTSGGKVGTHNLNSESYRKTQVCAYFRFNTSYTLTLKYNTNGGTISSSTYSATSAGAVKKGTSEIAVQWPYGYGHENGLYNAATFGMSRAGYSFVGWSLSKDGSTRVFGQDEKIKAEDIYPSLKNGDATVTLYAIWKQNSYNTTLSTSPSTVNLDLASKPSETVIVTIGGTFPSISLHTKFSEEGIANIRADNYQSGLVVSTVLTAQKAGKTTLTYSIRDNSTGKDLVTKSVPIVVTAPTYTVSYNANGGIGAPTSQTKYYDQSLTLSSAAPTRSGYIFGGWATSEKSTTAQYRSGDVYTSNQNITLYAVWVPDTGMRYRVNHYKQTLSGAYEEADVDILTGTTGETISPAPRRYEGYLTPARQSVAVPSVADTTAINYYYDRATYNVTLKSGEGVSSVYGAKDYRYGETVSINADVLVGYEWSTWISENSFSGSDDQYYTFAMPASNVVMVATAVKILQPVAHQHLLSYTPALAATEQDEGNSEYWYCTDCGKYFSDADATREITQDQTIIPKLLHIHRLTHISAVEPTCTEAGNLEYWYCAGCDKYFLDADATRETTGGTTTLASLEHNYVNGVCTRCGARDVNNKNQVDTETSVETSNVHFERVTIYYQGQFSDVAANQWFTDNVASAFELGLLKGNSKSTFSPYGDVTVAEAITMAARIHSIYMSGSENFDQSIGDAWYQTYLDYAFSNGIIDRAYYNSDVSQKGTRAQFAEIFAKSLPKEALTAISNVPDGSIPDISLSNAYSSAVYELYRAGILTGGDANGTFSPQTFITRAEAAAIVSRMAESNNRVSFSLR